MFLEHALVRGEYCTRGGIPEKNLQVLERVARPGQGPEERAARHEALADCLDPGASPADVTDGAGFEVWRQYEAADPGVLVLSVEDALRTTSARPRRAT